MRSIHVEIAGWRTLATLVVLVFPSSLWADFGDIPPQLNLLLVSSDKVLVQVDGKTRRLRIGETSPEGVELISLGLDEATFLFGGQEIPTRLSRSYVSASPVHAQRLHQVYADSQGMYRTTGSINGRPVYFIVDTGATEISMSSRDADRLEIDYRRYGKPGFAQTASSVVEIYQLRLNQVQVGEITLYSIEASVVKGDFPTTPLLGMSFLGKLEMRRESNILTLRQLD